MKTIEKKMVNAIINGKNFKQSNTKVKVFDKHIDVWLHNNLIAKIDTTKKPYKMIVDSCGWYSVTIKSRLNALGCNIVRRDWGWYNIDKDGVLSDFKDGQQVDFLDGKRF